MLDGGHLDLNSVQFCSDSVKERLKQTMLNQEVVFIGQSDLQSTAPGFKQKPLDLQLSADDFIRQSANELSGKGALIGFPIESKNSFRDTVGFDLNRPLSIDEDTGNRVAKHRSWIGKRTCGPPPEIIDLEDPNSSFSNKDVDPRLPSDLAIPNSCLKDEHNLQSVSKSRTGHVYHGSTSSRPFDDVGLSSKRHTLCETDFVAADTSVPHGTTELDLNTVPLEDLTYFSSTHSGVVNPVATSFSTITEKNNEKLGGKSAGNGDTIIVIDSDSDSGEELCNSGDPKIESVGSSNGLSSEIDQGPESPDSNIHCINSEAADILVQISRQTQANYLGGLEKSKPKVSRSKEQDRPQCSSDSYEAMVLNAKECGPEDYCVSSNAFLVDETEKKDRRYKLKRGTRMKDFQKDILSSLSTLSRHEIREDIHIFEGVIKSREYKRMRAKMGDGDNWCRATRSKRSRLSRRRKCLPS